MARRPKKEMPRDAVTGLAHDQVPTVSLKAKNPKKISRGK
jgi:hypothetical protein